MYTDYYLSINPGQKDVCYVNGKKEVISTVHPKGIIASSYGAKLISSNDGQNFTYRGRFSEPEQACTISYEASQKAHSALTWLAANQGVSIGSRDKRTYICWNPNGKKVMQPIGRNLPDDSDDDGDPISNTEPLYMKKLYKTLAGYKNCISENENIVIIALDAATTGRLSVVYYNELNKSDFYDRIEKWYVNCIWYFTAFTPEKKPYLEIRSPDLQQIVNCAFGTERNVFLETDDKTQKEQLQRIFHCMIDDKKIPDDICYYLFCRASTPLAYSRGNRERILSTACAVIRKRYNENHMGEEIKMELDYNNDRSYLFGCLLAIAEYVERSTYTPEDGKRETNAIRLQSAFVQHPFTTWKNLESAINPYYQKLAGKTESYFKKLTCEIIQSIPESEKLKLNNPLEPTYLLGYYLQRGNLFKKKNPDGGSDINVAANLNNENENDEITNIAEDN